MKQNFLLLSLVMAQLLTALILGHHWSEWINEGKCERKCSEQLGRMLSKRSCLIPSPSLTKQTIVNSSHSCESGNSTRVISCYDANYCDGYGSYTGYLSEWISQKWCKPLPGMICINENDVGLMRWSRLCLPSSRSKLLAKEYKLNEQVYSYKCPTLEGFETTKYTRCSAN
jgi:hypothetical protein